VYPFSLLCKLVCIVNQFAFEVKWIAWLGKGRGIIKPQGGKLPVLVVL
jgi:hypothetical protein